MIDITSVPKVPLLPCLKITHAPPLFRQDSDGGGAVRTVRHSFLSRIWEHEHHTRWFGAMHKRHLRLDPSLHPLLTATSPCSAACEMHPGRCSESEFQGVVSLVCTRGIWVNTHPEDRHDAHPATTSVPVLSLLRVQRRGLQGRLPRAVRSKGTARTPRQGTLGLRMPSTAWPIVHGDIRQCVFFLLRLRRCVLVLT